MRWGVEEEAKTFQWNSAGNQPRPVKLVQQPEPSVAVVSGTVAGSETRTYDNNFHLTSESVNSANTVSFDYDADSLLTDSGALSVSRDPQTGLVTGTSLGQVTDATTYNDFGEPLTYSASFNGTQLYAVQHAHDLLGRIREKTETIGGTTHIYDYTYDLAGRLTDVTTDSVPTAHYDYDANSNRTGGFNQLCSSISNAVIDGQDRLSAIDCGLLTASYTYTANGELRSKTDVSGTTTYTYDALGNLTHVSLPDATQIDYVIDGKSRRIGKKVNGALVQEWLYDGQLRIVAELDGNGNLVSRFVYGDKPNVPDHMIKGGVTYRLLSDHLGSPQLVVNVADGTVVQRMDYDEFGNVMLDTDPGFQPFGFAGGLYDRDTKLVRLGARDYDAQAGRWTAKDPIRFEGGDTNLYGYVVDDPVNALDPSGEDLCTVTKYNAQMCPSLPTTQQRCSCWCAQASDPACEDICNQCADALGSARTAYDECFCGCSVLGGTDCANVCAPAKLIKGK